MDLLESLKPDIILYIITCTIFTCSNFGYAAWLRLDNKKVQRYNMLFNLSTEIKVIKKTINNLLLSLQKDINYPVNNALPFIPINRNIFIVYDNLSANLGYFRNIDLEYKIMSTYEEAKYFVDCINDLNDISRKHLLLIDNKKESFYSYKQNLKNYYISHSELLLNDKYKRFFDKLDLLENILAKEIFPEKYYFKKYISRNFRNPFFLK